MAKFVTLGDLCVRLDAVEGFERRLHHVFLSALQAPPEMSGLEPKHELVVSTRGGGVHRCMDESGELFERLKRAMEAT